MGRYAVLGETTVLSLRLNEELFGMLKDLAQLEQDRTGRYTSVNSLVRSAILYVYLDNERMRECFRRNRTQTAKQFLEHA